MIYNEGWGQITSYHPEFALTEVIRTLDPTRLVDAVSGWHDHGAGDFRDNHHYVGAQCGTPWADDNTGPFDPSRIGFQGEFGGLGHNVSAEHLWKVEDAINGINQTYEMYTSLDNWNFRSHFLLSELLLQVQLYSCADAVWTETTDVEGELNGMLTYDRRIVRPDVKTWQNDIQVSVWRGVKLVVRPSNVNEPVRRLLTRRRHCMMLPPIAQSKTGRATRTSDMHCRRAGAWK
jgi:hypothetical protein